MFAISTSLVVLIVLSRYFAIDVPIITPVAAGYPFEAALIAWGVLFAAVSFNL
jgi:hypothetical protein